MSHGDAPLLSKQCAHWPTNRKHCIFVCANTPQVIKTQPGRFIKKNRRQIINCYDEEWCGGFFFLCVAHTKGYWPDNDKSDVLKIERIEIFLETF